MSNWLLTFLERAAAANYCTRIYCTTCGARDFRAGIVREASLALGTPVNRWNRSLARVTAEALAELPAAANVRHAEALRMLFHDMWLNLGESDFSEIVETRLNPAQADLHAAPAGLVLRGMREHAAQRAAARRAEAERKDPVLAKARREALKAERAAARAEWKRNRPPRSPKAGT